MLALAEMIKPEPDIYPDELILEYIRSMGKGIALSLADSVVNSLLSSGKVTLIMN